MGLWKAFWSGDDEEFARSVQEARAKNEKNREELELERARINARTEEQIDRFKKSFAQSIREKEEGDWGKHPNLPYLNRLKQELRKTSGKVLDGMDELRVFLESPLNNIVTSWFGLAGKANLQDAIQVAEKLRDDLFHRIENVANGNYQAEVAFLEGEIRKLRINNDDTKSETRSPVLTLQFLVQLTPAEIEMRISDYERDIAEVKILTAQSRVESPQPTKREGLKKREEELYENLAMTKERRQKLIALETKGVSFEQCSSEVQRRVKQIENMMDNQEQLISDELSKVWMSL